MKPVPPREEQGQPRRGVRAAATGIQDQAPGRLESIDALRGVGIAVVVALHVSWSLLDHTTLDSAAGRVIAINNLAAAFGVPLFLALSAFGLARRHDFRAEGAAAFFAFLALRARRLLPAYVAWSLASAASRDFALLATPGRVLSLLLDGTGGAQFYFVPTLFELYLWWPLLGLLLPRRRPVTGAALLIVAAFLSLATWQGALRVTWTPLGFFALYVAGGMVASTLSVPSRGARLAAMGIALVAAVLTLTMEVMDFTASAFPSRDAMALASMIFQPAAAAYTCAALVFFALAASFPGAPLRALAGLGRYAYGIFLCHLLLAVFVVHPLFGGGLAADASALSAGIRFGCEWAVTLALSAALTSGLAQSPRTRWLVGEG